MRKNKTIAFVMAAGLLVGGTFMGTKAWFTDNVEAKNDLVISMGKLDLEIKEHGWEYESTMHGDQEATPFPKDNVFMNVKPGDKFIKKVDITNHSTIDSELAIDGGDCKNNTRLAEAVKDGFITIEDNKEEVLEALDNNNDNDHLGTNQEKSTTLEIIVTVQSRDPKLDNNYNVQTEETFGDEEKHVDFDFKSEINPYVITAVQDGAVQDGIEK